MEFATDRADQFRQPPLDRGMNVLIFRLEFKRPGLKFAQDLFQTIDQDLGFRLGNYACPGNRAGIGDAAANVLRVQPPIKTDAVLQRPQIIVGRFGEPPTP